LITDRKKKKEKTDNAKMKKKMYNCINVTLVITVVRGRVGVIVEQSSGDRRWRPVRVPLRLGQPQLVLVHERGLLARPLGLRHGRPPVRAPGQRHRRRADCRRLLLLRRRGRGRRVTVRTPPLAATRLKTRNTFFLSDTMG